MLVFRYGNLRLFYNAKVPLSEGRIVAIPPGLGPGCRGFDSHFSDFEVLLRKTSLSVLWESKPTSPILAASVLSVHEPLGILFYYRLGCACDDFGGLAQLVEQTAHIRFVIGPSPIAAKSI